jgi:hypothetical protein
VEWSEGRMDGFVVSVVHGEGRKRLFQHCILSKERLHIIIIISIKKERKSRYYKT